MSIHPPTLATSSIFERRESPPTLKITLKLTSSLQQTQSRNGLDMLGPKPMWTIKWFFRVIFLATKFHYFVGFFLKRKRLEKPRFSPKKIHHFWKIKKIGKKSPSWFPQKKCPLEQMFSMWPFLPLFSPPSQWWGGSCGGLPDQAGAKPYTLP